jgi:predicted Fe-S protein YdhL (DUF1289 family)
MPYYAPIGTLLALNAILRAMQQSELFEAPSPCIGVCENSPKGYCKGCMRSRDERFGWHTMDTGQQLQVMKLCARRYQRMLDRKQAKANGDVNLELTFATPPSPQTDLI